MKAFYRTVLHLNIVNQSVMQGVLVVFPQHTKTNNRRERLIVTSLNPKVHKACTMIADASFLYKNLYYNL